MYDGHAEAVGDRGVNIHGFAGDAQLLGRIEEFEGAHIVDAVGKLDEDDADVVDHGEKHFADVFRLARFRAPCMLRRPILVTPSTRRATSSPNRSWRRESRKFGVFDDVVEKCGGESGGIQTHVREDVGDFEKVSDVGIAGTAELVAVAFGGDIKGAADQPGIIGRTIGAELGQELLEASVDQPLGAVAVEVEGYVGWRRHALVYDGRRRGERGRGRRKMGMSRRSERAG